MSAQPNYSRFPRQPRINGAFSTREFEDTYIPVPESGCWLTLHAWNHDGYGRTGKKTRLAHRLSYELHHGPIPDGLLVCHSCDTPSCVNPSHLFLGTNKDNVDDCRRKGRFKSVSGEANGASLLTESQVLEIRSSTKSQYALAAIYGVSPSAVSKARLGRTWKHLGGSR